MTCSAPRRRFFQFGLGTMLLFVGVIAAWLGWHANWVQQRHRFLKEHPFDFPTTQFPPDRPAAVPGLLWLFGESGETRLSVQAPGFGDQMDFHRISPGPEASQARSLFPEAIIEVREGNVLWYTWEPEKPWAWGKPKAEQR